MTALLLILVLVVVSVFLHAVAIKLGAKWAKVPGVTFGRAVRVMFALVLVSLVVSAVTGCLLARVELTLLGSVVVSLAITGVADCLLLAILLRTSVWRAGLVWLPKLGATIGMLAFLMLVFKPFVAEAFVQSGHAMAPTLFGLHSIGTCPHCGGPVTMAAYIEPSAPHDSLGICSSCQQPGEVQGRPQMMASSADRFVVCKFLSPARWDLVAVHTPVEPSALMVKRVVGMPGEDVAIRDGGIWIDGVKQELPAEIAKIQFATAAEGNPDGWGSPIRPIRLGPDEYFVLGDFALRSTDSRDWGPVPRKNVEGVVSLVYFPVYRWRLVK